MLNCNKCKTKIVLHAFSEGKCIKCGCKVVTSHIPCDLICEKCSEENNICKSCGDILKKD